MKQPEQMKSDQKMIYAVAFHVRPRNRVHTFWFTDKEKALAFLDSVKSYPKTVDYSTMQIPVDEAETYDGTVEEGRIMPIETNKPDNSGNTGNTNN